MSTRQITKRLDRLFSAITGINVYPDITVPIKTVKTEAKSRSVNIAANSKNNLLVKIEEPGTSSNILFILFDGSSEIKFMIDDNFLELFQFSGKFTPFYANARGYLATTPQIQLLQYNAGFGPNNLQISFPVSWKRKLEVYLDNPTVQTGVAQCSVIYTTQ